MSDPDDKLRNRLRDALSLQSEGGKGGSESDGESTTEQEADDGGKEDVRDEIADIADAYDMTTGEVMEVLDEMGADEREADVDGDGESGDGTGQEGDDEGDADGVEQEQTDDLVELLVANTEMDEEEAEMFVSAAGDSGDMDEDEDEAEDEDGGDTGDAEGELAAEAKEEVAEAAADAAEDTVEQKLDERLEDVVTEGDLDERLEAFAETVGDEARDTIEQALQGETPDPGNDGSTDMTKDDLFSDSPDNGGDDE
jgi:hypothetical protein